MHVGIDLGTSNSVLALFDGDAVEVVPNSLGETLTPSVVRLDARGNVLVGRRAQRFLDSDPANTRAEFKRLMGTGERLLFPAARRELLPEELSAEVLKSLLADARDRLGYAPRAAVISTPALFELPQNHATTRAGRLAGLEQLALIQEPIASAIAAGWKAESQGFWLVFDLGGGTLDVSLLETRDGWLRVVSHAGDNFLGGKDFDSALMSLAWSRLERGALPAPDQPRTRKLLAKLKAVSELAKIELSRAERASLCAPDLGEDESGAPIELDCEITRAEYEAAIEPLVQRSRQVCRELLVQARTDAEGVAQVVFVGGPTITPLVRSCIGDLFGGRIAEGVDPMTLVARGAALFAATSALEARAPTPGAASRGLVLKLEYPAATADPEPFVIGRLLELPQDLVPLRVRAERADGGFATPDTEVAPEGGFSLQVKLERQRQNRFTLRAFDAEGRELALASPGFAIVHGLSVADPPLSRSVGVARSDDSVQVYFAKGTPLPARRTFIHETVRAVARGSDSDVLDIPIVQGESERAHRNRLIGRLHIRGTTADMPAGTRVEITLQIDRSGQLGARADVASIKQSFSDVAHVLVPNASTELLEREGLRIVARLGAVRQRALMAPLGRVLGALNEATALVADAQKGEPAARAGDADAAQRTLRLLVEANAALDAAEEALEWPELLEEADELVVHGLDWVTSLGTPAEQQLYERAMNEAAAARAALAPLELERQLRLMRSLRETALKRHPDTPRWVLDWYAAHLSEATDLRRANAALARGRDALARGDRAGVQSANGELDRLFPGSAREQALSFGSGVK